MAGMGPPPNPNARRQNKRNDGFTVLGEGRQGPIPDLPGDDWCPATLSAWEAWWQSPQATRWTDADLGTLCLMASCYEGAMRGDREAAKEFRQWADRFGLSPLARLRNRWIIEDGATEAAAAKAEATVGNVVRLRKSS